jgi:zinc/manganese transport system substrate-binding protein
MRIIIVLVCIASLAAAGCGQARSTGGPVRVVAAENVYGDIVRQIGGSHVSVTSVLSDPNADPHLFEPGTRNGLAVSEARLVIQNGLGYDAFMTKLERAAPSSSRRVLTIADVLGVRGADANPHLWYDVPGVPQIAGAIADALVHVDPAHAVTYRRNRVRFVASLAPLDAAIRRIRSAHEGASIAYTEPVPGYLLAAAGLANRSPSGFTRAIEDGTEPSPQDVSAMYDLVRRHEVRVLLYNAQAVSPLTSIVQHVAEDAHVPVVGVTEMLPPRLTFQQWQLSQARALEDALGR